MQSERDCFWKFVINEVNEKLKKYGSYLYSTDLRWGINTANMSEHDANKKVLQSCMNEILKTDPYFISFIGERYGWVPDINDIFEAGNFTPEDVQKYEEKSVTEVEILYALNNYVDCSHCLFFIRNDVDFKGDEAAKAKYVSTGKDKEKLDELKKFLKKHFPNQIIYYDAKFEDGYFKLDDNFAGFLASKILENIIKNVNLSVNEENNFSVAKNIFDTISNVNENTFGGRKAEIKQIINFVNSDKKLLTISGDSGSGKTFLLSKISNELNNLHIKNTIFYGGAINNYNRSRSVLDYVVNSFSSTETSSLSLDQLTDLFYSQVNQEATDEKVVLIIDSLNQLDTNLRYLPFLNMFGFNNNVKVIVSYTSDYQKARQIELLDNVHININKFSIDDIQEVFRKYYSVFNKEMVQNYCNLLLEDKNKLELSKNPFYLSLLLQDLFHLNKNDYINIARYEETRKISFYEALLLIQKEIVKNAANSVEKQIGKLNQKAIKEIPISDLCFDLLIASSEGISSEMVCYVANKLNLNCCAADFSLFVKFYQNNLRIVSNSGLYKFTHSLFELALAERKKNTSKYLPILEDYYLEQKNLNNNTTLAVRYLLKNRSVKKLAKLIKSTKPNVEFYKAFCGDFNEISNKKSLASSLLQYDENYEISEIFKFGFLQGIFNLETVAKIIDVLRKFYSNRNFKNGSLQSSIYDLDITYAILLYKAKKYKKCEKIIERGINENKFVSYPKKYTRYFVGMLYATSRTLRGKKKLNYYVDTDSLVEVLDMALDLIDDKAPIKVLNYCYDGFTFANQIEPANAFPLLFIYSRLDRLMKEAKLSEKDEILWKSRFLLFQSSFYYSYNDLLNTDAFVASSLYSRIDYEVKEGTLDDIKMCLKDVDKYLKTSDDLELNFECNYNASMLCDNVFYGGTNSYLFKTKELSHELVKKKLSIKNISLYCESLNRIIVEKKILKEDFKDDQVELISILKLNVENYATIENYKKLLEAYKSKEANFGLTNDEKKYRKTAEKQYIRLCREDRKRNLDKLVLRVFLSIALVMVVYAIYVIGLKFILPYFVSLTFNKNAPYVELNALLVVSVLLFSILFGKNLFSLISHSRSSVIRKEKYIHLGKTIFCLLVSIFSLFGFTLILFPEINNESINLSFEFVFFVYPLLLAMSLYIFAQFRFNRILVYKRPIIKKHDLYAKVYLPAVYEKKNIKTVFLLALIIGLISIYPTYKIYTTYQKIIFLLMPVIAYLIVLLMPLLMLFLNKKIKSCNYLFDKAKKESKSHE